VRFINKFIMPDQIAKHITKGGPGDKYLGGGKVDTSSWFREFPLLEDQIRNEDIWFCSAPFQLLYTSTRGELMPCSWAQEGYGPNIKNVKLADYFVHDKTLNKMRKEMTTPGSDLETCKKMCKNCLYQEEKYGRSRRQASLKIQTNDIGIWPGISKAVQTFKDTGKGRITERIFEVQVKAFGNKCNLDCYMCVPYDSSTRLKTIHSTELQKENIFSEYAKTPIESFRDERLENIIDQIVDVAPYIRNLKFIGGEPLVMKQFYQLLEKIVATGYAKDMFVKYQTNMTVLELEKIKLTKFIPEFELFEFTVSVDGVGKWNDYIRRRSSWDNITGNIDTVLKYPNVKVNINGTISFLSVLRFYELINWFEQNGDRLEQVNWSNIRGPAKLCANVLPLPLKQKLIPKYKNFPDIVNVLKQDAGGLNYQDTLNYLIMIDNYYKGTKWEMNLFETFPELEEYYQYEAVKVAG
tara:strand:- start:9008 stop:10405 length:1398 start_codon:yes stop_codon:yes gene_type:complete